MKITDVVKPYNGHGCIVEWLNKVESAAALTGAADLVSVLPLLLEGEAYSVYRHLSKEDKRSVEKVKKALIVAFGFDAFEAFERLCQMNYSGESVDVYVAKLQNLATQAGIENDEIIRKKLVTSLPEGVSKQLRALANSTNADLTATMKLARSLMSQLHKESAVTAVAKESRYSQPQGGANSSRRPIECWTCGAKGHIARWCPNRRSGNETRKSDAPAASQQH